MDFNDIISSPFENNVNELFEWPINFYETFSSNEFDFSNTFVEKNHCNEQIQSKRDFYIFFKNLIYFRLIFVNLLKIVKI